MITWNKDYICPHGTFEIEGNRGSWCYLYDNGYKVNLFGFNYTNNLNDVCSKVRDFLKSNGVFW